MNVLTKKVARILFAIPFLAFGFMHLVMGDAMKGMVPSFLPGGVIWVYITGLSLVAAAMSIIFRKWGKISMLLLSGLLLVFILTIQIPGLWNPATMQMAMVGLLKDAGLLGGSLTYAGIFAAEETKSK